MVLLPPRFQASHKRPRLSSASVSAACLSGIFGTRVVVSRPELNENKKRYEFSRLDQEQCRFGDFVAFIVHGSVGLLQMDIFNTYQLHTFPSSPTEIYHLLSWQPPLHVFCCCWAYSFHVSYIIECSSNRIFLISIFTASLSLWLMVGGWWSSTRPRPTKDISGRNAWPSATVTQHWPFSRHLAQGVALLSLHWGCSTHLFTYFNLGTTLFNHGVISFRRVAVLLSRNFPIVWRMSSCWWGIDLSIFYYKALFMCRFVVTMVGPAVSLS